MATYDHLVFIGFIEPDGTLHEYNSAAEHEAEAELICSRLGLDWRTDSRFGAKECLYDNGWVKLSGLYGNYIVAGRITYAQEQVLWDMYMSYKLLPSTTYVTDALVSLRRVLNIGEAN